MKNQDKAKFESPEVVLDKVRAIEKSPEPKESSKERVVTSPQSESEKDTKPKKEEQVKRISQTKKEDVHFDDSDSNVYERREKRKQAPPRRPTFKRFATQTKEKKKIDSKSLNKIREGQEAVLSSPDEDLS